MTIDCGDYEEYFKPDRMVDIELISINSLYKTKDDLYTVNFLCKCKYPKCSFTDTEEPIIAICQFNAVLHKINMVSSLKKNINMVVFRDFEAVINTKFIGSLSHNTDDWSINFGMSICSDCVKLIPLHCFEKIK